jgi:hypothetical protein
MKMRKFYGAVCGICLFLILGLVGGVELGASLSNLVWCIPLVVLALLSGLLSVGR